MTKYDAFPGHGTRILEGNVEYWLVPDETGTLSLSAKDLVNGMILHSPATVVQRDATGTLQGGVALLSLGWSEQEALQGYRDAWAKDLPLPVMTPLEFDVSRHMLGLNYDQYAEMLQVKPTVVQAWNTGRTPISQHATRTIRLMIGAIRAALDEACKFPQEIPIYPSESAYEICDGSEMMWHKYHFAMNWDGYRAFLAKVNTRINLFG